MAVVSRNIYESRTVSAAARISGRVQVLPAAMPSKITVSAFEEKPMLDKKVRATFKQFKMDFWALTASLRAKFNVAVDRRLVLQVLGRDGKFVALTNQEDFVFACMTTPATGLLVVRVATTAAAPYKRELAPIAVANKHVHLLDPNGLVIVGQSLAVADAPVAKPVHPVAKMLKRSWALKRQSAQSALCSKGVQAVVAKHDALVQVCGCSKSQQRKPVMVTRGTQMARAMVHTTGTTSRPTMTRRVTTATTSIQCDVSVATEMDMEATLVPQDYDVTRDEYMQLPEEEEEEEDMESSVMHWNCVINEESKGYKLAVKHANQAEEELNGFDFADM